MQQFMQQFDNEPTPANQPVQREHYVRSTPEKLKWLGNATLITGNVLAGLAFANTVHRYGWPLPGTIVPNTQENIVAFGGVAPAYALGVIAHVAARAGEIRDRALVFLSDVRALNAPYGLPEVPQDPHLPQTPPQPIDQ